MLPQLRKEAKQRMAAGGGDKKSGVSLVTPPIPDTGKVRDKAAAIVNVANSYVSSAEKLKNESPEVFAKVKAGEITITQANREIKDKKVSSRRAGNAKKVEARQRMASGGGDKKSGAPLMADPMLDAGDSRDKAAAIVNVSQGYVSSAEKLKNESPDVFAKPASGQPSL